MRSALSGRSTVSYAVEHETPERIRDEALDVAVTALRLWLGEHKVGAHE